MLETIKSVVRKLELAHISDERKKELDLMVTYVGTKLSLDEEINLIFICTHNSRRSQFAQVWAKVAADYYDIPLDSFSGGVTVTACNERTVASLERSGFVITSEGEENPRYLLVYGADERKLILFSKLYDDIFNPAENFAAIMTCSDADENCPVISGAEVRIPLTYKDPKMYDDTESESEMYDACSLKIASEMVYVFSRVKSNGARE